MAEPNRFPTRGAFVASCLGVMGSLASLALGGCSFSLRDALMSPTRINLGPEDGASSPTLPSTQSSNAEPPMPKGPQHGFWMDTRACVGCAQCVSACRKANRTPEGADGRRRLVSYVLDEGPLYVSLSCLHCAQPACTRVCPAGAVRKRSDGFVVVDAGRCIGCRYCRQACPFGIPDYVDGVMDKCDCCLGIGVEAGDEPRCVEACPSKALRYGRIADLLDEAGGEASLMEAPTRPSFLIS